MTPIEKFIKETVQLQRQWQKIYISGGEPTLHPQLDDIINLILEYKAKYSTATSLCLLTNGTIPYEKISQFIGKIEIIDSKKDINPPKHFPVAVAPADFKVYEYADFSNGCNIPIKCAMGLNRYGYYQCTVAGAIDRIFGFDVGRKSLPSSNDAMLDLNKLFCQYCGHFNRFSVPGWGTQMSPTWQKTISQYKKKKPLLTLY
jgi:hypothetical protein